MDLALWEPLKGSVQGCNRICILVRSPGTDERDATAEARRPVREMSQWAREKVTVS